VLSESPPRSKVASVTGIDSSAKGLCSMVSMVRCSQRATPGLSE
jgi:hypothetical protein